ncbi:unnamed protein product [Pedinophyceae sp. YPF-701]|nr:unnamed protein product [Pedinophyceae sp. YPF-701]
MASALSAWLAAVWAAALAVQGCWGVRLAVDMHDERSWAARAAADTGMQMVSELPEHEIRVLAGVSGWTGGLAHAGGAVLADSTEGPADLDHLAAIMHGRIFVGGVEMAPAPLSGPAAQRNAATALRCPATLHLLASAWRSAVRALSLGDLSLLRDASGVGAAREVLQRACRDEVPLAVSATHVVVAPTGSPSSDGLPRAIPKPPGWKRSYDVEAAARGACDASAATLGRDIAWHVAHKSVSAVQALVAVRMLIEQSNAKLKAETGSGQGALPVAGAVLDVGSFLRNLLDQTVHNATWGRLCSDADVRAVSENIGLAAHLRRGPHAADVDADHARGLVVRWHPELQHVKLAQPDTQRPAGGGPAPSASAPPSDPGRGAPCADHHPDCAARAKLGACTYDKAWMHARCPRSCETCKAADGPEQAAATGPRGPTNSRASSSSPSSAAQGGNAASQERPREPPRVPVPDWASLPAAELPEQILRHIAGRLGTNCAVYAPPNNYWAFRVCYVSGKATQFHMEFGQPPTVTAEHLLGQTTPGARPSLARLHPQQARDVGAPDAVLVKQEFSGGAWCAEAGRARALDLLVGCSAEVDVRFHVSEDSLCRYTAVLLTRHACDAPVLVPARPG